MVSGKKKRLKRIMPDGKTVIVPMDHGVSMGPIKGLENMQSIIDKLTKGGVDSIVIHKGIAKNVDTGRLGLIIHISGSTKYSPKPNWKVKVGSVVEALRLGADAVSVHINVGDEQEALMLEKFGSISEQCEMYGIPLLAMMYPRGEKIKSEHDPEAVALAARLGAELGADIVKTNYTGDKDSFQRVVDSCPIPVIIAGGPKMETSQQVLKMVYDSLSVGCRGISIGRNVFQHEHPNKMCEALSLIIHNKATVEEALKLLGE
jgi:fructose-bisphosphate aldolase/2-amino-3,7-dideoxy-D-threo-hept-6-ulosonate synthase